MTGRQPPGQTEVDGNGAQADAFRLAAILESSPDAIIAWSLQGKLTDWNPAPSGCSAIAATRPSECP